MAELKPCPCCGYAPQIGYACGEYFVMGTEDCPFCDDFLEMHSSESTEIESWNRWVNERWID